MKKITAALITMTLVTMIFFSNTGIVYANVPYQNYNYSTKNTAVLPAPEAALPGKIIYGNDLGADVGAFSEPSDIYITLDGTIYIADSGNNRILAFDSSFKLMKSITQVTINGEASALNHPRGVFVNAANEIYIADTDNNRVLYIDKSGNVIQTFNAPKADFLGSNFVFSPIKVAADKSGRTYVIGQGTVDGVMEYNEDGTFSGFIGANRVKPSLWDLFWKRIATQQQKDFVQFVPVDYTSVDIDDKGFVYATTYGSTNPSFIKKLNAQGVDIMRNTSLLYLVGDMGALWDSNGNWSPSIFVDVCLGSNGLFSCLDRVRGHIFTYDRNGDMLYVFGGLGDKDGLFKEPTAIAQIDDEFYVTDKTKNSITVFKLTDYAKSINNALYLHGIGEYDQATTLWKDLIIQNKNLELAHVGVGKALLREGKYKQAMTEFKLGNNKAFYTDAYKDFRSEYIRKHNIIFIGGIILMILLVIFLAYRKSLLKIIHIGRKGGIRQSGS